MTVRGLWRVERGWQVLRTTLQRRVIVLMYHRVFEPTSDPWRNCVRPERFAAQLAYLRQHYSIVGLRGLATALRERNLPRRAVVLTLDDGYLDNLIIAKPLLERYEAPATAFVTTGYLGAEREFWWDELERLILLAPELPAQLTVAVRDASHDWDLRDSSAPVRKRVHRQVYDLLNPLAHDERDTILRALRAEIPIDPCPRPGYRPLTSDEVGRLAESNLVEVGSHSVTHPRLSAQPRDVQRWEMVESKRRLEAILGRSITSFCYPYGSRADVGGDAEALAQEAGFEVACSSCERPVTSRADPFWLPRFAVLDWDAAEFGARLQAMFRR